MNTRSALALLGYTLALAFLLELEPTFPLFAEGGLLALRSKANLFALLSASLLWASWGLVKFVPVGMLSVFVLPDQPQLRARLARVLAPALALAALLCWLVLLVRGGPAAVQPVRLLLGWLGALTGCWLALSFRRGRRARLLIVPKLAALLVLLVAAAVGIGWLAIESAPRLAERADLGTAQRRELVALFRDKDPRKLAPGERATLSLSAGQLDQLVAWGAAVGVRGRTQLALHEGGLTLQASVPVLGRWLNVSLAGSVALNEGVPRLEPLRLQLGKLTIPGPVLRLATRQLLDWINGQADGRAVLAALSRLSLTRADATLVYEKADVPPGLAARLMWGDERRDDMQAAVSAQLERLLQTLPGAAEGDARFELALTTAFTLARERTIPGSAVAENRAALLALGIVLGHSKLVRVLGERLDEPRARLIEQVRAPTTRRARNDWARHFSVSAALTVIADVAPSNAMGLLKEELDADGGSGFSFADLLADRAGTRLASVATRDEQTARRMQQMLAADCQIEQLFPSPEGLPEGIPDAELRTRYGGVGGLGYRKLSDDIERRIAESSICGG